MKKGLSHDWHIAHYFFVGNQQAKLLLVLRTSIVMGYSIPSHSIIYYQCMNVLEYSIVYVHVHVYTRMRFIYTCMFAVS